MLQFYALAMVLGLLVLIGYVDDVVDLHLLYFHLSPSDRRCLLGFGALLLRRRAAIIGRSAARRWQNDAAQPLALATVGFLVAGFPVGGRGVCRRSTSLGSAGPAALDIRLSVGLDGLSVWLFGLTALLMVVAVLVSWEAIHDQPPRYYRLLLLLETGMLGVFIARDIILFYVFFEFTLIPLFFLIGIWGSEERRYAAVKFFLFTLAGSVLTFLGLLAIVLLDYYRTAGRRDDLFHPELTAHLAARPLDPQVQFWIFLALFAGFAIKVPLFPLHTWLPLAHVAGARGRQRDPGRAAAEDRRLRLPAVQPADASPRGRRLHALAVVAGRDRHRLRGPGGPGPTRHETARRLFQRQPHGLLHAGIFALNRLGIHGGALQMINHGLSTGGLFAVVGMIYERYHTRQIADLGGLAQPHAHLAFFMWC